MHTQDLQRKTLNRIVKTKASWAYIAVAIPAMWHEKSPSLSQHSEDQNEAGTAANFPKCEKSRDLQEELEKENY